MTAGKGGQNQWEEVGSNRGDGTDVDSAHFDARFFLDFSAGLVHPPKNGLGSGQKGLAGFGEPRETREAVEESGAQLVFELMDLLRKRGLRDVLIFGRAGKVSGSDDCAEIARSMRYACLPALRHF